MADSIALSISKSTTSAQVRAPEEDVVDIFINSRNLIDIVRDVEQPFAVREGKSQLAGQYEGLPGTALFLPSRHLLGEPTDYENYICEHEKKIVLYRCGSCGVEGCWPLLATITVSDDTVTWSDFEQPHRDAGFLTSEERSWAYESLGPSVFDLRQYEEALRDPRGAWATSR